MLSSRNIVRPKACSRLPQTVRSIEFSRICAALLDSPPESEQLLENQKVTLDPQQLMFMNNEQDNEEDAEEDDEEDKTCKYSAPILNITSRL